MTKILTYLTGALLLLAACTRRDTTVPWNRPPLPAQTLMNLAYDTDTSQKLDLYLPARRSMDSTPLLVLIHGGAWSSGSRFEMTPWVAAIQQRLPEYAIANISYRLARPPANTFPTQEVDVQKALTFLHGRRGQYQFSDRFVLLGYSAGGHLALLHSYKRFNPVAISAVVSFAGPSDMEDLYEFQPVPLQMLLEQLLNGNPVSNPQIYYQSSPINYVGTHSTPTFLLQGGMDSVVPYTQADALQATLESRNVTNSYIYYPMERHIFADTTIARSMDTVSRWLRRYVR